MIGDRKVLVAYLDADFQPVDKGEEKLLKLMFDDGEVVFLIPDRA